MKTILLQLDIVWRDKAANYSKVRNLLKNRSTKGALVVLPEMFATGFDVETDSICEGQSGSLAETGDFLSQLARDMECTIQGSGIAWADEGKRHNIAVTYGSDGQCISTFQKLHPFTYGGEHVRFQAGNSLALYSVGTWRVAPFICYDLRFPEEFRHAALQGAQILVVAANWPAKRHAHWLPLLQARAIENQCYVVGVNRAGRDPLCSYLGESVIFGPLGERLAHAGAEECVLEVEMDADVLQACRNRFPVLQDVRKGSLGLIESSQSGPPTGGSTV